MGDKKNTMSGKTKKRNPEELLEKTLLQNRYQIEGVIRKSGLTITYSAFDQFRNTKIWIKELYPKKIVKRNVSVSEEVTCELVYHEALFEHLKEVFVKKAKAMIKVYPVDGINNVLTVFSEHGTEYAVLELAEGTPFSDYLQRRTTKRMTLQEAVFYLNPISEALSKLHETGVIHGRISLDSFLITKEKKLVLMDFLEPFEAITQDAKKDFLKLNEAYSPVELFMKEGKTGTATDVYSFAAVLYRCITACEPPKFYEWADHADQIKTPWELKVPLLETQSKTIMKAMASYYGDRFVSMKDFMEELAVEEFVEEPSKIAWYQLPINFLDGKKIKRKYQLFSAICIAVLVLFFLPKIVTAIGSFDLTYFYYKFEKASVYEKCEMLDLLTDTEKTEFTNNYELMTDENKPEIKYFNLITKKMVGRKTFEQMNEKSKFLEIDYRENDKVVVIYYSKDEIKTIQIDLEQEGSSYVVLTTITKNGEQISSKEEKVDENSSTEK